MRQKEVEKLQALKQKLDDQKKHLDELDKHVYVAIYSRVTPFAGQTILITSSICRSDQMDAGKK